MKISEIKNGVKVRCVFRSSIFPTQYFNKIGTIHSVNFDRYSRTIKTDEITFRVKFENDTNNDLSRGFWCTPKHFELIKKDDQQVCRNKL